MRKLDKDILCDPVWPNVGVQYWYQDVLIMLLLSMSSEIVAGLMRDWIDGVNTIGFAVDAPNLLTLVQRRLDTWAKKWTKRWDDMADQIALDFATKNKNATEAGVRASFAKAGFTIKFKPTRGMLDALRLTVKSNVTLIKSIPEEYIKGVSTSVYDAVRNGGDMATLQAKLQKDYGIAARRAAFIARDQNNKAKATLEEQRRSELGITEAIWQHSNAGKEPRPTHVEASQQRIRYRIKDGWPDPDLGDKKIWPGTEPNCRCTSRAIIPGLTRSKYYASEYDT